MFKNGAILLILLFFSSTNEANAADVLRHLEIESAMQSGKVLDALNPEIKLFFSGDTYPQVIKSYGIFTTSKRTNSFLKDKVESCEWALASALQHLQQIAVDHNAHAVIEISSNIKNNKNASNIHYDCLVGSMMVNVALQAKIVKIVQ